MQRLTRGALPLDEALPIAKQIAEALEAAHEQGIIHRDLKPANIKLRLDGTVKVLDFGLAKALEPLAPEVRDVTASPTITSPALTELGMILGTAAYMSPEQAKGRQADKRSDVWAFGAVVYEMLSGQRAFKGDGISNTLAAVLRQDLDWTSLPPTTPPSVRHLLARCLERDVTRRLRDIGEARIVLDDPAALARVDAGGAALLTPQRPLWRRAITPVLSGIVAALMAGAAVWYLKPLPPLAVTPFSFHLPEGQMFPLIGRHVIAMSPDGGHMLYVANGRLYLKSMSELDAHVIQGTESFQNVTDPVFSPDGRSVACYAAGDQTLKTIATTVGRATTICSADNPFGISWGPESLFFGQGSKGVMQVSRKGGTPTVLVAVKDGEEAHGPQLLPDGQHVLFTLAAGSARDRWDKAKVIAQSLTSGERKILFEGGSDARYVPTGHLVYAVNGILYAIAFNPERLEVMGDAVPMVEGIGRSAGFETGAAHFSLSNGGSLIYIPGPVSTSGGRYGIALMDRNGDVKPLNLPPGPYSSPRISPDGTRIAFGSDNGKEAIIYTYELSGGTEMKRVTFGGRNQFPVWLDARRIAVQSDRDGAPAIFWQPVDGGDVVSLTKPQPGESHAPESWSSKADRLLFAVTKGFDVSLRTYSIHDRTVTPFREVRSAYPTGAMFSHDGRWVAYATTERGKTTIYVEPFPSTGIQHELPAKGSDVPHAVVWSPDGRELFYVPRFGGFEAVAVTAEPRFGFGTPVAVPRPPQVFLGPPNSRTLYDITSRGQFVVLVGTGRTNPGTPETQIQVVLNWLEELKARVPTQ